MLCEAEALQESWLGAHLRRFLSISVSGRHSRCLCGPGDGLGACKQQHHR